MPKLFLNKTEIQAKTGVNLVISYFIMLITNSLVLLLASSLFPHAVVLGTYALSPMWALMLASGKLTLLATGAMPFVAYTEWRRGRDFTPKDWMLTYFVLNVIGVWVLSRFASHLGFGISGWVVAVLLGAALDWVQGMVMMAAGKFMLK